MKIGRNGWKIIVLILLVSAFVPDIQAQEEALLNNTSFYLSTGQNWTFYQDYTITLKSVDKSCERGWVQLKLNNTVVKSGILSNNEVFYYNISTNGSNETVIFSLKVSGIYSGEDTDIVTFSPVFQYYQPGLAEPTAIHTQLSDNPNETKGTPDHTNAGGKNIPGFQVVTIAIIICIYGILLHRN
jgi:hypothetical protein